MTKTRVSFWLAVLTNVIMIGVNVTLSAVSILRGNWEAAAFQMFGIIINVACIAAVVRIDERLHAEMAIARQNFRIATAQAEMAETMRDRMLHVDDDGEIHVH